MKCPSLLSNKRTLGSWITHLSPGFRRGHYEKNFCEIILNLVQWFKDISYLQLWQPFCFQSGTTCAILVEALWGGSNHETEIILKVNQIFLFLDLAAILLGRAE